VALARSTCSMVMGGIAVLETLLEEAALKTPLLVGLDDMQWADRGTIAALRALPAWLAALPIVWIAAYRPAEASPDLATALDDLEGIGARRLVLGPLSEEAVQQIAGDVMGAAPSPSLLELAERAQGSPFLLMELLLG
jgi:predicted ATPase